MNDTFKNLLEKIKNSTNDTSIHEAFENAFNTSDTINEALEEVTQYSIKNKLDIVTVSQLTVAFRSTFSDDELNQELFLTKLNNFDIDTRFIDVEMLQNILEDVGFNTQKNNYYDYKRDKYFTTEKDIKRHIKRAINENLITDKIELWMTENYGTDKYIKAVVDFIIAQIRDNNQYQHIKYESVPFEDSSSVSFDNQVMTIRFNNLFSVVPAIHYNDEIVKDYKEHFEDLDKLLEFIVAARFGTEGKRAYVWFRAQSDWGKSFLFQGVFGELKLTTTITESELKKAYSGAASAFNADMFIYSWILFIDEFKSAVSEIKNITHKLTFSPKFQGQVTVPVYAKLFSSAENVRSLHNDGMVEQQYKNRITFWTEEGKLTSRPMYVNNQMHYRQVLTTYVYEYLEKRANEYIALGEIDASNEANKVLNEIIESKAVDTVSVEEVLAERIAEFKENYMNYRDLESYYFEHNNNIYITHKGKFIDVFLEEYFDEDAHKTIKHKDKNVILDILETKRKNQRIGGKPQAGYLWIQAKSKTSDKCNNESWEYKSKTADTSYDETAALCFAS